MPRELLRLIESAMQAAPGVQRHRDDAVRVAKYVGARCAQHQAQRPGERTPTVVLECVQDVAQRPFVVSGRAGRTEQVPAATAARALLERRADDTPRRQRVAADAAERGNQRPDIAPARCADRPVERRTEHGGAGRAARSERNGEDRV